MANTASSWLRPLLCVAAAYNVLWGAWAVFFPEAGLRILGSASPLFPELWQCIGMMIAAYGVGYGIAAINPLRHWPIVCVGLLTKILTPVVFLHAVRSAHFPVNGAWVLLAGDIIWWIPFALILHAAWENHLERFRTNSPEVLSIALRSRVHNGVSLEQLSRANPLLIVFLRHAGCTFCREALADLAQQRQPLEQAGVKLVLVHMGEDQFGRQFFRNYGLADIPQISDPHRTLYRAFGLRRGDLRMLFGPKVWWRGLQAGIMERHGVGRLAGDGFQMPGIFLVFHGQVIRCYRHQSVADRPNYVRFATSDCHEVAS